MKWFRCCINKKHFLFEKITTFWGLEELEQERRREREKQKRGKSNGSSCMAQSGCTIRYSLLLPLNHEIPSPPASSLFSSVTITQSLRDSLQWNRCSSSWIGNLWRTRLQAPKPFLQRCLFFQLLLHFYFIIKGSVFILFIYSILNISIYLFVQVWHTASLYHLVHTAALVAAPITKNPNLVSSHFSSYFIFPFPFLPFQNAINLYYLYTSTILWIWFLVKWLLIHSSFSLCSLEAF